MGRRELEPASVQSIYGLGWTRLAIAQLNYGLESQTQTVQWYGLLEELNAAGAARECLVEQRLWVVNRSNVRTMWPIELWQTSVAGIRQLDLIYASRPSLGKEGIGIVRVGSNGPPLCRNQFGFQLKVQWP